MAVVAPEEEAVEAVVVCGRALRTDAHWTFSRLSLVDRDPYHRSSLPSQAEPLAQCGTLLASAVRFRSIEADLCSAQQLLTQAAVFAAAAAAATTVQ